MRNLRRKPYVYYYVYVECLSTLFTGWRIYILRRDWKWENVALGIFHSRSQLEKKKVCWRTKQFPILPFAALAILHANEERVRLVWHHVFTFLERAKKIVSL